MADAAGSRDAWSPSSWRALKAAQQPDYSGDRDALNKALAKVSTLPGIVCASEVDRLRSQLAKVAAGDMFVIQGGDCAEDFRDCVGERISNKLKILLQMSLIITWQARVRTVRIGRMAGQFAKPRSSDTEVVDGETVKSFRGDNVNGFSVGKRRPDPKRLVEGYFHSVAVMNHARALISTGFADVQAASSWDLGFVKEEKLREDYKAIVERLLDAVSFLTLCGGSLAQEMKSVDLFVSHEGLLLGYEEAMTHEPEPEAGHYNLSTHFLWIGDRTRQLDGAHVEYFRGLRNPIGLKVGPSMAPTELVSLARRLNPSAEPGKLVLITRFGADKVASMLPPLIAAMQEAGLSKSVVWLCDPMHGNTRKSADGLKKTRAFDDVMKEIAASFGAHREATPRSWLGGVHLELTGEDVTECVGGPEELLDADLHTNYTSYCDPRLNYAQSLTLSFMVAELVKEQKSLRDADVAAAAAARGVGKSGAADGRSAKRSKLA